MKLLYSAVKNADLDDALSGMYVDNIFTTEYDCYKIFYRQTGNQNAHKYLFLYNSSGKIVSNYSYSGVVINNNGVANERANVTGHGGTAWYPHNLRDWRYIGYGSITVWYPADTTRKTLVHSRTKSVYTGNYYTHKDMATVDLTLQAVTGFGIQAYGIGEDIEMLSVDVYGIK